MSKKRLEIEIGKEYGWVTVIEEMPREKYQPIKYRCRCRCGEEVFVTPYRLINKKPKCRTCATRYGKRTHEDISGKTYKTWFVIEEAGKNKYGAVLYKCRCTRCGKISLKTKGELTLAKGGNCKNCEPDYNFRTENGVAIGTLSNGDEFLIDEEDISRVGSLFWHMSSDGYIVTSGLYGKTQYKLHNFIFGGRYGNDIVIDHINRDKTDCRKSNLRYVNNQQNGMNQSRKKNSYSGFKGVTYVKSKRQYRARIWLNGICVYLGSAHNPVIAAQMYNVAAKILFRQYAGDLNDVPLPSREIIESVKARCQSRLEEAEIATQPVGIF